MNRAKRHPPTVAEPWTECPVCHRFPTVDMRNRTFWRHGKPRKGRIVWCCNSGKPIPKA